MSSSVPVRRVVVLSRSWGEDDESSFVMRGLAGALSRLMAVSVVVPGDWSGSRPDGLFDLYAAGGEGDSWPDLHQVEWPEVGACDFAVIDGCDDRGREIVARCSPTTKVVEIGARRGRGEGDERTVLTLVEGREEGSATFVGLHVPVNPMAKERRHNALGMTGYLLVLSDRPSRPDPADPTPLVSWLASRFPRRDVLVVEGATAAVWHARSLHGVVNIDTRIDLWRLMAHSSAVVDLAPGSFLARECIEALRFGAPIIVPENSVGAMHAANGGGMAFEDPAELFDCVERLGDEGERQLHSVAGQRYADDRYGHADLFLSRLDAALGSVRNVR